MLVNFRKIIFYLFLIKFAVNSKKLNQKYWNDSLNEYSIKGDTSLNYCSFFNNRAPSPQVNLKNCTWYKENSCCLQREIESTFSKVKPLIGSSIKCQKYLNNLMCYICAPNQFKFYGKERLTVCLEYCNLMYEACSDAILKGAKIREIYENGEDFCESRRYNIDQLEKDRCFYRDIDELDINSSKNINIHKFFSFSTIFNFLNIFLIKI